MIVVLAELEVDPENVEAMKEAIRTMESASREYVFSPALSDPAKLRINELWESTEALETHFGLPHMARSGEMLTSFPPRGMQVRVYELGAEQTLPGQGG